MFFLIKSNRPNRLLVRCLGTRYIRRITLYKRGERIELVLNVARNAGALGGASMFIDDARCLIVLLLLPHKSSRRMENKVSYLLDQYLETLCCEPIIPKVYVRCKEGTCLPVTLLELRALTL